MTTLLEFQLGEDATKDCKVDDSLEEKHRVNDTIFKIIREKTNISEEKLTEVMNYKRDRFITAEEALSLGIITEII